MRKEEVKKNEHGAGHNGIGTGLTYFDTTAFDRVTIEGGNTGNNEGKEKGLDDTHPEEPLGKGVLQTRGEVGGCNDMPDVSCGISTDDAAKYTEDNQEGNDGDQTGNLGQNQIGRGIDTHNFECIDLLCGASCPTLKLILEPTLPARIKHMMLEENSSNMISRVSIA